MTMSTRLIEYFIPFILTANPISMTTYVEAETNKGNLLSSPSIVAGRIDRVEGQLSDHAHQTAQSLDDESKINHFAIKLLQHVSDNNSINR